MKAGDTLAMLDVPEVSAKLLRQRRDCYCNCTSTKWQKMQQQTNLSVKSQTKGLAEQFEFAQKSYKRASNMFKDSLMSPQSYDEILQNIKVQKLN